MASEKDHHIPAWDGTSRTWRRYTREVCWYVRATPVGETSLLCDKTSHEIDWTSEAVGYVVDFKWLRPRPWHSWSLEDAGPKPFGSTEPSKCCGDLSAVFFFQERTARTYELLLGAWSTWFQWVRWGYLAADGRSNGSSPTWEELWPSWRRSRWLVVVSRWDYEEEGEQERPGGGASSRSAPRPDAGDGSMGSSYENKDTFAFARLEFLALTCPLASSWPRRIFLWAIVLS